MKKNYVLIATLSIVTIQSCKKEEPLSITPVSQVQQSNFERVRSTPLPPPDITTTAPQIAETFYCGLFTKSTTLFLDGVHDTTISDLDISSSTTHAISLINCYNVTILHCRVGPSVGNGINIENCTNMIIKRCHFEKTATAVYALNCKAVQITGNESVNVQGPYPRGQMVQFNNVTGSGNSISYNKSENIMGQSFPEDAINLYMSGGTIDSPVQIVGNWIRGGGPSATGGGIMLGDNGGTYVNVQNNYIVNPGQYGIGIASGTNITMKGNKIYAKQQAFTNVGIYVYNQYASPCAQVTMSNNAINWTGSDGAQNPYWDNGNCGTIAGVSTNLFSSAISNTILPYSMMAVCL